MESATHKDTKPGEPTERRGPFFTFFVDDREFHVDEAVISGAEIMNLAGIPREAGLVLLLEDGTQRTFGADETIDLEPGRRFKKAPRFKRG
jgi:hypothetical protein